uniref:ADAMTS-like 7 n=1 Tax=Oreochromis niloticus TaxID=8128 RepID=I3JQU8_ORENI
NFLSALLLTSFPNCPFSLPPLKPTPTLKHTLPSLQMFVYVSGNFSRTFLHVGYHKIAEIPAGACNISIQETKKSQNYLALLSRRGVSIINGNWLINRPGIYAALGTHLTYRRPNEIRSRNGESITAPGPLTEDLHVYVRWKMKNTDLTKFMKIENNLSFIMRYKFLYMTDKLSELKVANKNTFQGEIKSLTETVSKTMGFSITVHKHTYISLSYLIFSPGCLSMSLPGKHQVVWECVEKDSQTAVPADFCHSAIETTKWEEDCNIQPCPAYWDVGEWSECSRRCGPGTQHRQVICRQVTDVHAGGTETSVTVTSELCGSSDMPVTQSTCQLKICSQWDIRSEWSPCSVPCGVGQRTREVVCVSNQGDVDDDQECNMNLKPDTIQNCDMGLCARSWFTSIWSQRCSAECGRGSRTRSVVCLMDHVTNLPLDSCEGERPPEVTSCDSGPCQNRLEWYTGPWSQCSAECGNGTQTRSVACIFNSDGQMEVVDQLKCSSLSKPITAQPCRLKPCGVQWYVTEWSACSRTCNAGFRVREVRCLADNIVPSDRCDPSLIPESREECNEQPCVAEIDPLCSDKYHNCMVVVQARLCVYSYYRSVCCASCSRAQENTPQLFSKQSHTQVMLQ